MLRRALAQLTYRSLCPLDDLADRRLLGTPGALYAHDALRLWEITARWVRGKPRSESGVGVRGREGEWGSGPKVSMGQKEHENKKVQTGEAEEGILGRNEEE